jgi:hypothetical protein
MKNYLLKINIRIESSCKKFNENPIKIEYSKINIPVLFVSGGFDNGYP